MSEVFDELQPIDQIIRELNELNFERKDGPPYFEGPLLHDLEVMIKCTRKIVQWKRLLNKEGV